MSLDDRPARETRITTHPLLRSLVLAVFNFDSVSTLLVERMLAEGRLPTLHALCERGRRYDLTSPLVYFGDRVTAHTGVDVQDHGLYFPLQWSPTEQRLESAYSPPAPPAVWERLADVGRAALVLDPYEGRPPHRIVGAAISGVQFTHSVVLRRWARPRGVDRQVMRMLGRPRESDDAYGELSESSLRRVERQVLAAPERTSRAALHFLERETFDLVWVEFGAVHLAGHHFWPRDADEVSERMHSATVLQRVYELADAAMGRILAALPADADVLVFTEAGMDANRSRTDVLPEMLARVLGGPAGDSRLPGRLIWKVRSAVPPHWRLRVTKTVPDEVALRLWAFLHLRGVDWSSTRAFSLPSDHDGYIRLNVRGRERDGIVDSSATDGLIEEISSGLRSFRDSEGTPCVDEIHRVADVLGSGANDGHLPDLLVTWNHRPTAPRDAASSPQFGEIAGGGIGRAGNHVAGAWLVVVPGTSRLRDIGHPPRLVDIAATACALLGADAAGLAGDPLLVPKSITAAPGR